MNTKLSQKLSHKTKVISMKKVLIFLLLLIVGCGSSITESEPVSDNNKPINAEDIVEIEATEELPYIAIENKHIYNQLVFTELGEGCAPYLGQSVNIKCFNKLSYLETYNFEIAIVSIIKHNKNYYVLEKSGRLYKIDLINSNLELMIDFSEKVDDSNDRGAKGFAFSKNKKTFAISYVNELKQLKVDLYSYENNFNDFKFEKNLLSIQNEYDSISWHYGGHIIWSENFDSYVTGIGDFTPAGPLSRTNENPLRTNSFIGKLILLNDEVEISYEYEVLKNNIQKSNVNILAIGLRNPWQFFEIGEFFVIPDVGFSVNEELNITKIDKFPVNFGWPVYEGELLSEEIDNLKNYNLLLNLYEKGIKTSSIVDYTKENSTKPVFTYNHQPVEEYYRGAIVGGDIFTGNTDFQDTVIFGDHVSGELFLLNITNKSVLISPFAYVQGGISSIKIFDEIKNTVIVSTMSGDIHIIEILK
ncbi:MAG: hypothetical protein O3A49_05055 [Candidatus Marinimicrobia bacterium]|nr:hypothetical protein [Candidatus Neomarinimicrobiota bacterium]